jgi:hypothetical protein
MSLAGAVRRSVSGPNCREADGSYSHLVAKTDVPRVPPQGIARTSMQMVLIVERLLAETGHPVRSRH